MIAAADLDTLLERELNRFRREHPRSLELTERAKRSLLGGVPMHWMVRWAGGFPVCATEAEGAWFRDADGHEYVDFCLGDTGAMTGHSPEPTVRAVAEQSAKGITLMLPSEDALWVGEELARRFGLPEPGFHDALRRATRETGTLLVIDETHTICSGPGGYTAAHGLEPDLLTIGKPIAGGIPAAAYGFSDEVASRVIDAIPDEHADVGGIGGTLAANVLSLAAMKATLGEVLTAEAFERMIALGERFEAGVQSAIDEHALPWHVVRLGCRVEYLFRPEPARTGAEAAAGADPQLDRFIHLYALNRGILLTPFHSMALMSPATTEADVDRHTEVFEEAAAELAG